MATLKWYVESGAEEIGPLGPTGLRRLVQNGEIQPDTWVRREDYPVAVPAAELRGLFLDTPHAPRAKFHGPYSDLRAIGWSTAAAMFGFALLGGVGVYEGVMQWRGEVGRVPLFGLGVFAVMTLLLVGALFLYWLWLARGNLPHLIHAHVRYGPAWTVAAWFLPGVNLVTPYAVIREIDRLSATAEADGNPRIGLRQGLLLPWWLAAVCGTGLALFYMLSPADGGAAMPVLAVVHGFAGAATFAAGVLAGVVVLRITNGQDRAHARHPAPVERHHAFGHVGRAQRRHGAQAQGLPA